MNKIWYNINMVNLLKVTIAISVFIGLSFAQIEQSAANGGYPGLFAAPKKDDKKTPSNTKRPLGYSGVISGTAPVRPEPQAQTRKTPRTETSKSAKNNTKQTRKALSSRSGKSWKKPRDIEMSTSPTLSGAGPIRSMDELRVYAMGDTSLKETKAAFKKIKLPARILKMLSKAPRRYDGLTSTEYKTKLQIDEMMINLDYAQTRKERRALVDEIKENLTNMMDNFYLQKSIPNQSYSDLGLSDAYIEEQNKGIDDSIERLDVTLKL